MAGRGAPTYLKRQKEQQRAARAQAKREAKLARRERRANGQAADPVEGDGIVDAVARGGFEEGPEDGDATPQESSGG